MARIITSFDVRISGLVTFSDQSSSIFHVQSNAQSWSISSAESFNTTSQIGSDAFYYTALSSALGFTWTNRAKVKRKITDMIARVDSLFTCNDQTTDYASMVIQGANTNIKGRISTEEPAINIVPSSFSFSIPVNIVDTLKKIQADLGLIMTGVSFI